ncbi:MAG: hypothetical protein AABZ15_16060 [Nitrospirota bacterium]
MGVLTMDKTDIFIKSAKGEQEIATRVNKLPIKHRSVLIMVDGTTSEEALLAKISGMFDGKIIVNDLETHGFIERKAGSKSALQAATAKPQVLNVSAKQYMIDYMYQVLGPEADTFVGRIEKCRTNSDLAGMIDPCRDTILGVGKQKRAAEFEVKIKELMG